MNLVGVRGETVKYGQNTASLIDVVFLLLIYFMATASLIRKEGDLSFRLPSPAGIPLDHVPVEVFVEIGADGTVALDGMRFAGSDVSLGRMAQQIEGLKRMAIRQGAEFHVCLLPHRAARHQRVVNVLDACSRAGVEMLAFGRSI